MSNFTLYTFISCLRF